MGSCLQSEMTLWSRDIAIYRDKIKPLYLHYQSALDYQTCQDGNLPSSACVYKITWPFDQVVLNCYISTTTEPMATKLGRMVIYFDELLPIKSHETLKLK